ncbi:MAG: sulfatase-like hydrolase/transferase, partial [Chloroflexi bacterium]|nr:sulfatase-like hydrolase/transferase [Chloroflexota bacterium]
MNVIFLMNDTFRRDHLGCYGNTWIHTPNLDRLAKESVVFDRAYIGSYPTVPNRWDLATGRYGFPYRGWQPMDKNDVSLAQMLSGRGYATMFIHDTPMLAGDDMNYTRGFSAFRWVRGQHSDPYNVIPRGTMRLPAQAHKLSGPERFKLYFRNIAHRQHDREYMVAKSVMEATDWLEENHDMGPFFLWLDMWDPHEQFDPPWYDWDRYRDPKYNG